MNPPPQQATPDHAASATGVRRVGCVGYLNAKPLIEGLEGLADPLVRLDVPSGLLADLENGEVDIALCPVIDYYRSNTPLVIVPVGCIASDGPTQTVRLFSRVPIPSIRTVHADSDSHTSVALLRVLLDELHGVQPGVVAFDARGRVPGNRSSGDCDDDAPEAMLLIGDKVVNDSPSNSDYPYQMDMGEAWKELTGLPFVFAVWMARRGEDLADLPGVLDRQRERNAKQINAIADRHAGAHGWEPRAARRYLGRVLSYRVGPRHVEAIGRFADKAEALGLIERAVSLELWRPGA